MRDHPRSAPASLTVSATRRGGDRRVGVVELGERRLDELRAQQRPRGVVDDDRLVVPPRRGERVAHRRRARVAPLDDRAASPPRRACAASAAGTATTTRRTTAPRAGRRATTRASDGRRGRRTPSGDRRPDGRRCRLPRGARPPWARRSPTHEPSPDQGLVRRSAGGYSAAAPVSALRALEDRVEVRLGLVLALLERVHQLGREDLLGARVHLLLARRQALVLLADGEVADDLGELVDVAGLDLVPVVLEPAVPVLRHLGDVVGEHREDLLDGLLVDHAAKTGLAGVLDTAP